jgi:hypothetical protein
VAFAAGDTSTADDTHAAITAALSADLLIRDLRWNDGLLG